MPTVQSFSFWKFYFWLHRTHNVLFFPLFVQPLRIYKMCYASPTLLNLKTKEATLNDVKIQYYLSSVKNCFSFHDSTEKKMAFDFSLPFSPKYLTPMCDRMIRNWYRHNNGYLVFFSFPVEILSLSVASTPSPVCLPALSSFLLWDSCLT